MSVRWDRAAAAHLARRAGFGGTPAEIDALLAMGLEAAVSSFVAYDTIENSALEADLIRLTTPAPPATTATYDLNTTSGIQKWFLHRMVFTRRPLEEKMTLLWNNHFTSGIAKVNDATLILKQNKTERSLAIDRFDDLVLAITKDPAMILWLDNRTNVKGRPNENYARELMELFTLGVDRYTQKDVSDLARALTGWTIAKPDAAPVSEYAFSFNAAAHDAGVKTILGQTGNWNADEAIGILLNATDARGSISGRFLAGKLWTWFVYHDPPDWAIAEIASVYVSSGHSVRAMLDHLFRMPEFYEPHSRQALVRSPVEYIVAPLRQLEAKTDLSTPVASLNPMGQSLFNPLDAKGWEGDLDWVNTGTVFARATYTNSLVTNRGATGTRIDVAALLAGKSLSTARDVVSALADRLGLADALPASQAVWEKYVDSKADGSRGYWTNTPAAVDQKVRGLLHLMLTSPDYHLC
ncbi:MAG: DUF1800 domain-containing protein [Acidobacteria bacterium]|nr:DUF1800 domain-containing protein [Acidobacteriota bacterium]MCA1610915.1 DUF1800 domain-containing protein [Acidobacteriota bacterium]MCA1617344.1 DUF1800 domain-containing protein [Acidobacteriota bacterium]